MTFPLFLIPILAGLAAQALKPVFSRVQRNAQAATLDPRPHYGGMPSAHTAFATSLLVVAGMKEGIDSAIFAIAVAVLIFTIDDALRLRIFLSRYGLAIRRLLERAPAGARKNLPPVEHRMGHTIPEVLGGMVVGLAVTFLVVMLESVFAGA